MIINRYNDTVHILKTIKTTISSTRRPSDVNNCDFILGRHRRGIWLSHGPLARYVKLRVAHAPGMPGTFSPPPRVSDPDMHHGTCVMHVP